MRSSCEDLRTLCGAAGMPVQHLGPSAMKLVCCMFSKRLEAERDSSQGLEIAMMQSAAGFTAC